MSYWIQEDFDLLRKWAKQKYDKSSYEHIEVRKALAQKIYPYTKIWAEKVRDSFLKNDIPIEIKQAAFDAGQNFYSYQWAKIFPSKYSENLAYTVGIDADLGFEIKIDTVKLGIDEDPKDKKAKERVLYESIRGPKNNSSIVSILPITDGLEMDIEHLVEWTIQEFQNFSPTYEEICKELGLEIKDNTSPIIEKNPKKHSLNQILYGPAGTGKTYNTINYALSILDGRDLEKQQTQDDRNKFKKYMAEGRISFVTFHQSYGYEDFVEGIKVVPENNQLTYPVIPGIFKKICQLASANVKSNISEKFDLGKRAIWKMSLGRAGIEDDLYRSCLDNDVVLLGWGDAIDFTGCNELQAIKQKLTEFDYPINQLDTASSYVNTFKNKIKNGDLVVITDGNLKFRAIAEVIGAYEYDSEQEFSYHQVRKVKWLKSFSPSLNNEDYFKKIFSQSTVYNLENAVDKDKLQNLLTLEKTVKRDRDDKFVLIIDEINRGNISKIFGELITLIEESKRMGKAEALEIILPNSPNVKFGVPENLYIIGTMNSSDRSLTSVDIALRRRFEFIEMQPQPEVLKDIVIQGLGVGAVSNILEVMNKRIKVLLDRDHCIGHAYFTPLIEKPSLENLMHIFEKRIIPLLQEYFFDDWTKINLVLGENGMVHTMNLDSTLFLSMNPSEIEHLKKRNWDVNNYLFQNAPLAIKVNALKQTISPKKDYKIPKLENTVKEVS
ncbi:hypothetical protein E0H77_11205 [Acinetobacter sp. ANC 4633]|uniref:AAA family ATPase n=1 Tax=Acinetobacter sp. ANC 4633 TaxID=2529845 RepID=UPI00103E2556|nr:AAA family ATPase [Acinetobacter sp. ANC 4633]TCB24268.1 hypothetical protein E0H77_11205 [Acinetobacter sp. ANC 4633]